MERVLGISNWQRGKYILKIVELDKKMDGQLECRKRNEKVVKTESREDSSVQRDSYQLTSILPLVHQ